METPGSASPLTADGALARLLHAIARPERARVAPALRRLLVAIVLAGALYGAAMGGWRPLEEDRWKLVLFGAIKSPLLIVATTLVVLPGFFVLNTVAGLREDFRAALRAVLVGQAGLTIALASLAPVIQFVYATGVTHQSAILANAVMFAGASLVAQVVMWRWYRPLVRKSRRHLILFGTWLVLYAFVGIQIGWMLRPFIGNPGIAPTFLREEPFTNAYVALAEIVRAAVK